MSGRVVMACGCAPRGISGEAWGGCGEDHRGYEDADPTGAYDLGEQKTTTKDNEPAGASGYEGSIISGRSHIHVTRCDRFFLG